MIQAKIELPTPHKEKEDSRCIGYREDDPLLPHTASSRRIQGTESQAEACRTLSCISDASELLFGLESFKIASPVLVSVSGYQKGEPQEGLRWRLIDDLGPVICDGF